MRTPLRPNEPLFVDRRSLLVGAAAGALAAGVPAAAGGATGNPDDVVTRWLDLNARPLAGTDPALPDRDLRPLREVVGPALIVGLGESAHGTHEQFALKHRVLRMLVERLGFRTLAWEDAWGAGVAVDRYIRGGPGDPQQIVANCGFNLQNAAMLDLMAWLRQHNSRQPSYRQVRFVGADVVQLRDLQFEELEQHVRAVAPGRLPKLQRHLDPLRIQQSPGYHIYWYTTLPADRQQVLVEHARAVDRLVRSLANGPSPIDPFEARLHALALLGFYESYTKEGDRDDTRGAYIARILSSWQNTTGHRVTYCAANAHTAAATQQTISFPPDPPRVRRLAGGRLRAAYGHNYTSVALTFDHGTIRAGWDTGNPSEFTVPPPPPTFIDHGLGAAHLPDYLIDLREPAPHAVRTWLRETGKLRVIGGASYDPASDADYSMTLDNWGTAFDAILHLRTVRASRLP